MGKLNERLVRSIDPVDRSRCLGERDDASDEIVSAVGELEDEGRYRDELDDNDDDVKVLSKRDSGGGGGEVKSCSGVLRNRAALI
jgi:hypothetical protein